MEILRTPDNCFSDLKDYPYKPHYTSINTHDGSELRIHHIDEGPKDGPILLAMHGQPVWSYLYIRMIPYLNYYKKILKSEINKKMICTNPDLIVDKGEKREYCAGSVAKVFEDEGGKVDYFGKPYPLVYNEATKTENKKILCVGDNLNTDIKGANNQNFNSLFIFISKLLF